MLDITIGGVLGPLKCSLVHKVLSVIAHRGGKASDDSFIRTSKWCALGLAWNNTKFVLHIVQALVGFVGTWPTIKIGTRGWPTTNVGT
jgi:hypothetical protein